METLEQQGRSRHRLILIGLIALGALLRFAFLGTYPLGLNQDEASIGYEAWSVMNFGADRNGNTWPVLFKAWGSGQNALYAYLSMPFIALFGLNRLSLRLVSAILGTLTLPLMYAITARLRSRRAGLCVLAVVATNPWHIMISRWALESNIFPFFLMLGLYLVILSLDRPWFLTAAGAVFALSLYAYGTAFIVLPILFVLGVAYVWRRGKYTPRHLLTAAAVFVVVALPIGLCQIRNALGLGELKLFGVFTLPELLEGRQVETISLTPSGMWANIKSFVKLMVTQWDGLIHNSIAGWLFFPGGLVLAAAGVVKCLIDLIREGGKRHEFLVLATLAASVLSALIIDINVNRINMVFLPILYFSGLGLWWAVSGLGGLLRRAAWLPAGAAGVWLAVCLGYFSYMYLGEYQQEIGPAFFDGLGEALYYVEEEEYDQVQITGSINMPYIYVLFYMQIPPDDFWNTVEYYYGGGGMRSVLSFGHYSFGLEIPPEGVPLIATHAEAEELGMTPIAEFGNYVVAMGETG